MEIGADSKIARRRFSLSFSSFAAFFRALMSRAKAQAYPFPLNSR